MRHTLFAALSVVFFATPGITYAYDGPVVVDDANFLDGEQLIELQHKVEGANTENEFLLVILTVPTLEGQKIELYAKAVMRSWEIHRESRDDGLLLLVVRDEMLPHFRAGQDVQRAIGAEHLERVRSEILIPAFERQEYLGGLVEAVDALGASETGPSAYELVWVVPAAILLIFVYANTLNRKRRACPHCGKKLSPLVSRCPSCLENLRAKRSDVCPCGSKKPYEECCLDAHCEGTDSHRIRILRGLDMRYLMQHSTILGGYTGGGPGELPQKRGKQDPFDGSGVVRRF